MNNPTLTSSYLIIPDIKSEVIKPTILKSKQRALRRFKTLNAKVAQIQNNVPLHPEKSWKVKNEWKREKMWKHLYLRSNKIGRARKLGFIYHQSQQDFHDEWFS